MLPWSIAIPRLYCMHNGVIMLQIGPWENFDHLLPVPKSGTIWQDFLWGHQLKGRLSVKICSCHGSRKLIVGCKPTSGWQSRRFRVCWSCHVMSSFWGQGLCLFPMWCLFQPQVEGWHWGCRVQLAAMLGAVQGCRRHMCWLIAGWFAIKTINPNQPANRYSRISR